MIPKNAPEGQADVASTAGRNGAGKSKATIEAAATKPKALAVNSDHIPAALKRPARWVCWRYVRRRDKKGTHRWTKVPIDPKTGANADTTDPSTWATFAAALAYYETRRADVDGVGFVLGDGWVGVDLDDVRDPETGEVRRSAAEVVESFKTYTEVSPSATGLKLITRGGLPGERRRKGHVEMYDGGRFFALTGCYLEGTPAEVHERQDALDALYQQVFGLAAERTQVTSATATAPPGPPVDDEVLLAKARGARNGEKFGRLYDRGDISGYDSSSEADLALCDLLAFWSGPDAERIDRLFRGSQLCREKWTGRADYRDWTVQKALAGRTQFYDWPGNGKRQQDDQGGAEQATDGSTPPEAGATAATGGTTGREIILTYFRSKYQPVFRRGPVLYSGSLGREVRMTEACAGAGKELIVLLLSAEDVPRSENGTARWNALPGFFQTWCRSAWVDLLDGLRDEEDADEVCDVAQDEFRSGVAGALHTLVPLSYGYQRGKSEPNEIQRRSLIDWCQLFAKPGPWARIRSYQLWTRRDAGPAGGVGTLRVVLRVELFQQLKDPRLSRLTPNKFGRLAENYGVGTGEKNLRVQGRRAVELTEEFINELLATPAPPDEVTI
ncbi:MAG TPA: hypothetical protein VJ739_18525 [Gemmataceae bacterium]|nr:hypothetical protein [Gemmataceae bacterium]